MRGIYLAYPLIRSKALKGETVMETVNIRKLTAVITILALSAAIPAWVAAQTVDESTRNAVERTREVIAEARPIIEESRSNIARLSLERAIALQNKAEEFLIAARNQFAYKYTMEARQEAMHAIALARADARIEDKLQNMNEQAMEKISRLRDRVMDSGIRDERLNRLISEARTQLENSMMNARQLRNQIAMNLAENAVRLTRQAEERFRKLLSLKEVSEHRLMLCERLMERARERMDGNADEKDASQMRLAERNLVEAREMIAQGKYDSARMTIENCERLMRGLSRKVAGEAAPPEQMMDEALRLLERTQAMLSEGTGSEEAEGYYERARVMIAQAREEMAGGRNQEAVRTLTEARRVLRRAVDSIGTGDDRGSVEAEIGRIIDTRDEITGILEGCKAEGARSLFARANLRLGKAMDQFEKGNFQAARAEARIARNLFQRVREICVESI